MAYLNGVPPRLIAVVLISGGVAGPSTTPPLIRFEEIAAKSGLQFVLRNGAAGQFHQIELTGGGVAALDYNNDGCTDIFFTNGAAIPSLRKTGPEFSNRLFRNNCDMTFTDVTAEAGLAGEGYSTGVAVGDFDNDGFADIFVTGVNGNHLYRNLGNGRFADVTARAGVGGTDPKFGKMWAVSAGWLDYDNDGWLDLFVSNYVVWDPEHRASLRNAGKAVLLSSQVLWRPALPTVPQQPRRHVYRCLAIVRNRAAYREGDGNRLRGHGRRRPDRHFRGQRFGPQCFVSQSRRRNL